MEKEETKGQWLTIGPAAKYLGVSRDTLRRWEKKGKIKAVRSPTNRRYYTERMLDEVMNRGNQSSPLKKTKKRREGASSSLDKRKIMTIIVAVAALVITVALGWFFFLRQGLSLISPLPQ